ncbi:hypothetical protein HOG75_03475 [bacterium]|nr:hypothetical protein [bacterium]
MTKTIAEINEKIKKGVAVIVTAEEVIDIVAKNGLKKAAKMVDVVTTGTFAPMCSSGVFLNFGHSKPKIKLGGGQSFLNDVPLCTSIAAVDAFLGVGALPNDDPRNKEYPGHFNYGGGHVIEDLVSGKDLQFKATAYGTDCYPRKKIDTTINIKTINQATLFNIRNCYQNYNVAANISKKKIHTYLGVLKPNLGNVNYCSAGQLSPLLNDPHYKTIGIGTKIFLGGGVGYVAWPGTQHNPYEARSKNGIPTGGAGTLAVIGDLKQMSSKWLRGVSMLGYGVTMSVSIGIPIPILNEEILKYTAVKDEDIYAPVVDYSDDYPNRRPHILAQVSYAELKSGKIKIKGKEVPTASLSSYSKALEIANTLKKWIEDKKFFLTEPVALIPDVDSGYPKGQTLEEKNG